MSIAGFGKRLRELRVYFGDSQEEFARKTGTSNAALSRFENEVRFPGAAFFDRTRNIYSVNLNWLLSGQGGMFSLCEENPSEAVKIVEELVKHAKKMEQLTEKLK